MPYRDRSWVPLKSFSRIFVFWAYQEESLPPNTKQPQPPATEIEAVFIVTGLGLFSIRGKGLRGAHLQLNGGPRN